MSNNGPYISRVLFCERIDEDERGSKSFINTVDTLTFDLSDPDAQMVWDGMLEVELVFGEFRGEINLQMAQVEAATGERKAGLNQNFDTEQFDGVHSISLALEFKVGFPRTGLYWHEFLLNGEKMTQVPLTVRSVD